MIRYLIGVSARHRGTVIGMVLVFALLGAWSATQLPCDALPDTGDRQVIVFSRWDRSPGIIEDQVRTRRCAYCDRASGGVADGNCLGPSSGTDQD